MKVARYSTPDPAKRLTNQNLFSRNNWIRRPSTAASWVSHSHMTRTSQPSTSNASAFLVSRALFLSNFSRQYSTRVEGMWESTQPSCECQKQPWTWMIFRCRAKTRSGRPGNLAECNRNLKPMRCTNRRTASSGLVSLLRIRRMFSLLRSGEIVSIS
jgi:hypothetical protein